MPTEEELFASVDALLREEPQLPPPGERARLREAAGVTQARLAAVLKTTPQAVRNWENGRSEPKSPRLEAYQRLLAGWAEQHPAHPAPQPQPRPRPEAKPRPVPEPAPRRRPAARRPAPAATSRPAVDPRFPNGPLAVLDGDGTAHAAGGVLLDCPATTLPRLVEWTLDASGLGAPRLHRHGTDADPLLVLTADAATRLGLPERLTDRRALRLPEDHPAVTALTDAGWRLTRRGFGPWARVHRPAEGNQRRCVQFAILPWNALDERSWPGLAELPPPDIARALGVYARRVLTPRGSTAVTGLELMTALRPPTRAVRDEATGGWVSGHHAGSLGTRPVDPAPPEATAEHPVVVTSGWEGGFLDEEAYQWVRPVDLLTDEECLEPWAIGLDLNTAFLAAAARLVVGLSGPEHVDAPAFDPRTPGSWLVDLSHIELDPRLPSPFTPDGTRPTGPAWYATHTVAYAAELGHPVTPVEGYLRRETGAYLDPWHDRLKDAYVRTLADLGVTADLDEAAFLDAMARHRDADPALAAVLTAIKATVKGGVGKLRERPQGRRHRDGERWPALERPTWRPDIRAAVISKARVNMHRKLRRMAEFTGRYPLAVLSDCVVYPSPGDSPLDLLPRDATGAPRAGTFRLGPTPGRAKLEGVQEMARVVDLMEQGYNPARHIKGDGHDAVLDAGE
ncbi:Helix-turn-helix [Streptomyces zhaozhouensis]|uniref:Helix-turn-helix n=1 Tax=Streptomyces zhaozhouensis TaxID=1300267 RepID=A0A286DVV3_9ACTN|nr:helix-turn-helix domain-containing protein [Streptomyces zhaozhouensis]SOD62809.1 Helix-turn-helix [Streptomyces zhaozhouensis]